MYPIRTAKKYNPSDLANLANIYTTAYLGNYVAGDYEEGAGSHCGVDIMPQTPADTVFAVLDGTVHEAKENASEGKFIIIKHDGVKYAGKTSTYYSCYLHLSDIAVTKGQTVKEGDVIGKTGNTGMSTGEHLHFQIDTAEALFHPYWPFSFKEAKDLGLGFMEAVNRGLGIENAQKYTVNPLVFLDAVGSKVSSETTSTTVVTEVVKPTVTTPTGTVSSTSTATTATTTDATNNTTTSTETVTTVVEVKIAASTTDQDDEFFSDVPLSSPHAAAIQWVKVNKIASGQNGKFFPNANVSRGEILKMGFNAAGGNLSSDTKSYFPDVPSSSPFIAYVNTARERKAVGGYEDGTFRPNAPVSRAEWLKILLGIQGVNCPKVTKNPYPDVSTKEWYAPFAAWSSDNQVLEPVKGLFAPNRALTRGEVAMILWSISLI